MSIPSASFAGASVPRAQAVTLFGAAAPPPSAGGFQCDLLPGLSFEWAGEAVGGGGGGYGEPYLLGFEQGAFGRTLLLPPRFLRAGRLSRFRLRACYTGNPQARGGWAGNGPCSAPRRGGPLRALRVSQWADRAGAALPF